jgi:pimeloyl-ACP methyl ester carboxylesterase
MTPIVYLHGFASSPSSSKAQFFRRKFDERSVPMEIPQLDEGNFEGLTISGQLKVIERAVAGKPAILMGSSLGGYLAALYAARHPEIERLVLLAPAFQFLAMARRFSRNWRDGSMPVFTTARAERHGVISLSKTRHGMKTSRCSAAGADPTWIARHVVPSSISVGTPGPPA